MHFTVNLCSRENHQDDFSYGLAFIPCPVWMKGTDEVLNLNPERPDYRMGSIKKLIRHEKLAKHLPGARIAHIIVHPEGHGSADDILMLNRDLLAQGFSVHVYGQLDNAHPAFVKEM